MPLLAYRKLAFTRLNSDVSISVRVMRQRNIQIWRGQRILRAHVGNKSKGDNDSCNVHL